MALFLRQVWTLTVKNLLITVVRHPISTPFRAFLLPVIFFWFISYARNLFIPASVYGIGTSVALHSLPDALNHVAGGRTRLIFVNSGFDNGDIQSVINAVVAPIASSKIEIQTLQQEEELLTVCQNSIQGTSQCIAAGVFYSSPTEGNGGIWNYSIRADGALESKIVVNKDYNNAQIYVLPLQHAIDREISRLNTTNPAGIPDDVQNYPFTSITQQERSDLIRIKYQSAIINILAIAFFIGFVGVSYQLTGLVATEREIGMAQLLDAMMPNKQRWQPQLARIVANHLALDIVYGPGWIIMGVILGLSIFSKTSMAINIIFALLTGLAMSSLSIFAAGWFKKAQLSGIITVIVCLLLGIVAQVAGKAGTGSTAVLSLLFPPMNFIYFVIFVARWEQEGFAASLVKKAPNATSAIPGIAFWIFSLIQIFVYPILGAMIERTLYGTASRSRTSQVSDSHTAVSLKSFTKIYRPTFLQRFSAIFTRRPTDPVVAVNDLNLEAVRGEIMILLGANGSGKSTTLDAIAGLNPISSGEININYPDARGGLGFCPQKNVLWDLLTVTEHVRIFNRLKSHGIRDSDSDIQTLLASCDIDLKARAFSRTLSGGQKRKLQLAMMFTGGSSVCCVDEVSSGLDPLSRRKIWDILLAERGNRSIILTTHFLDEADLLADHIAILSRGVLKASGTSVELKHKMGAGYRVHVYHVQGAPDHEVYHDTPHTKHGDQTIYLLASAAQASQFITQLEADGCKEYQVSGPTIEDVFLKVAEEVSDPAVLSNKVERLSSESDIVEETKISEVSEKKSAAVDLAVVRPDPVPELLTGKRISIQRQALVLFGKRFVVFRRNALPYVAAFIIPVIAAGLVTLFLKSFELPGCDPIDLVSASDISSLSSQIDYELLIGPASSLSSQSLTLFAQTLGTGSGDGSIAANLTQLEQALTVVSTLGQFSDNINTRYANITPGGVFLGDSSTAPVFAWHANNGVIAWPVITQNILNNLLSGISIATSYQAFDVPWPVDVGKALQLTTYFGLAMCVYPAFFALYPNIERLRNVRGLHYSNGVRAAPLWLAYTAFDFVIVLIVSAVSVIIFRAMTDVWYHVGYLFVVFFLYGLASILLAYVVSLFAKSQLAAFAFAAAGQAIMFLVYFIAFMCILTYVDAAKQSSTILIANFTISLLAPICNVQRALFVAMNIFSTTCRGRELAPYPGSITTYGGPILYLTMQSLFYFALLLWWDTGSLFRRLRHKSKEPIIEEKDTVEGEVSNELTRVTSSHDGLRVLGLTKRFKKNLAVNDITFGVPRGEVFALLGPNGAGKSTCISLIRGDIQPSNRGGDILVEDVSVIRSRAQARSRLGVCPQFDAMDIMTVAEHLDFYAKVRGVADPKHNVQAVMQAVGLQHYAHRMAAKLSGGNKRKLSLGIALMGNPGVLLLDEPSSGMDAASKRVMWRTLSSVVPGRSLVLTTHSMEEADALASRAGIMASKMLALGTTDYLRRKHGDAYYVHLVHSQAPHTSELEMEKIRDWVKQHFPDARIESKTYHGQLRFEVPARTRIQGVENVKLDGEKITTVSSSAGTEATTISNLFAALEKQKSELAIEYYSVSRATLDQVFLNIVRKHNVEEEDNSKKSEVKKRRLFGRK